MGNEKVPLHQLFTLNREPTMSRHDDKHVATTVSFPRELMAEIAAHKERTGATVTATVRLAVSKYLADQKPSAIDCKTGT